MINLFQSFITVTVFLLSCVIFSQMPWLSKTTSPTLSLIPLQPRLSKFIWTMTRLQGFSNVAISLPESFRRAKNCKVENPRWPHWKKETAQSTPSSKLLEIFCKVCVRHWDFIFKIIKLRKRNKITVNYLLFTSMMFAYLIKRFKDMNGVKSYLVRNSPFKFKR